jgi:hypothetical protein
MTAAQNTPAFGVHSDAASDLLARQNPDGGWSYDHGSSWTEPTCYALLGLWAAGVKDSQALERGAAWLEAKQNPDGGFAPRDGTAESTWVTTLVMLAPEPVRQRVNCKLAVEWLLHSTGQESTLLRRLRLRLLGVQLDPETALTGWPWYPSAAAWVTPTALSVLALERIGTNQVLDRVDQGRKFLLARRCRDFGWNHGSTHALGYDSSSYPETTGAALLALHGASTDLSRSLAVAQWHLSRCRCWEAASWLVLGLTAHGLPASGWAPASPLTTRRHASTVEIALDLLARAAVSGRNVLLGA